MHGLRQNDRRPQMPLLRLDLYNADLKGLINK